MSLEELLNQRLLTRYSAKQAEVEQLLTLASRDLGTAQALLSTDLDWAYNIVYNAMLQAGRALMFMAGYRPRGQGQHRTVVRFCGYYLDSEYRRFIALMDQMRRKRHRLVYERAGLVSRREVEQALDQAEVFVALIGKMMVSAEVLGSDSAS